MKNAKKNVYWGYGITHIPKVGENMYLTKVEVEVFSLGVTISKKQVEIGPIQEIEQIGENMSIIWTEEAGYAVYWTPRS